MVLTIQDLLNIRTPMTRDQAVDNVDTMKAETPLDAQKKLLEMATHNAKHAYTEKQRATEDIEARLEELRTELLLPVV